MRLKGFIKNILQHISYQFPLTLSPLRDSPPCYKPKVLYNKHNSKSAKACNQFIFNTFGILSGLFIVTNTLCNTVRYLSYMNIPYAYRNRMTKILSCGPFKYIHVCLVKQEQFSNQLTITKKTRDNRCYS